MIEQTPNQGAIAAKVCGAVCGGCVVFMTGLELHPDQVERTRDAP